MCIRDRDNGVQEVLQGCDGPSDRGCPGAVQCQLRQVQGEEVGAYYKDGPDSVRRLTSDNAEDGSGVGVSLFRLVFK